MRRPPSCLSRGKFTLAMAFALYDMGGKGDTVELARRLGAVGVSKSNHVARARRSLVRGEVVTVEGRKMALTDIGKQWMDLLWKRKRRPDYRTVEAEQNLDRAERQFRLRMGAHRYTDIPAHLIRPQPLWRPPMLLVRSLTGNAAGMCVEQRGAKGETL